MAETGTLRLFPLNAVLFPGAVVHLHVFEERYRTMIAECLDTGEAFGVVLIRDGREAGDPDVEPHEFGTTAEIAEVTPLPAGRYAIRATGERRFRIERIVSRDPYLLAQVEFLDDAGDAGARAQELSERVAGEFREYVRLLVAFSGKSADVDLPDDPVDASYVVGDALQVADGLKLRQQTAQEAQLGGEARLGGCDLEQPLLEAVGDLQRIADDVARIDGIVRQIDVRALPGEGDEQPHVLAKLAGDPFAQLLRARAGIAGVVEKLDLGEQIRIAAHDALDPKAPFAGRPNRVAAGGQRRHITDLGRRPDRMRHRAWIARFVTLANQTYAERLAALETFRDHLLVARFEHVEVQRPRPERAPC